MMVGPIQRVQGAVAMPSEKKRVFSRDSLLTVLPADLSQGLLALSHPVVLAANKTLFRTGDACDGCYQVVEGLLKVFVVLPSMRERILAILGPGGFIGELSMMDGAPRSATVIALRPSKLQFISQAAFDEFAGSRPEIYRYIADLLARRLRDNSSTLAMSSLSLKTRAAVALLGLADAFGKDVGSGRILIRQKLSQGDLAAMAGIARENLSRLLQDWMQEKLISRLAGYYCLENKAALEREANR
jgi:CRP-like cAMP-binding protein